MAIKIDDDYIELLNKAVSGEIQAIVQYMTQHSKTEMLKMRRKLTNLEILTGKNKASVLGKLLKDISIAEMKHAEKIAERIFVLGGESTTRPSPIKIGDDLDDFLANDLQAEKEAMELYRKIIKEATERGDITTKKLFMEIYAEEEEHYWSFDEFVK
ncbi:MAG: ferritin-like domain-containing protein [Candidatus Helarchaeota archaeon]